MVQTKKTTSYLPHSRHKNMFAADTCASMFAFMIVCVVAGWLGGVGMVAVGGNEQPFSFHSNTLTQSVSMATDNSIS